MRSKEEIRECLDTVREFEPACPEGWGAKRAKINTLEWMLDE